MEKTVTCFRRIKGNWIAQLQGTFGVYGSGENPNEAIGDLMSTFPERFDVVIDKREPSQHEAV